MRESKTGLKASIALCTSAVQPPARTTILSLGERCGSSSPQEANSRKASAAGSSFTAAARPSKTARWHQSKPGSFSRMH